MKLTFYAQPYDITAFGFYFESLEDYREKAARAVNDYGDPIEEFEIQFIDGENIDCELAMAVGVSQTNLGQFFAAVKEWDDGDKTRVILAVREWGYVFTSDTRPDDFDLEIHECDTLRDLAERFVEEGLFGDITERLRFYIDYDAIAHDLGMDYAEATVAGNRLIYRCA